MLTPPIFFKALSDETRCKLLLLILEEKELCVCELSYALDTSQPKVSRHLSQLRANTLLKDRRQGQWVFYSLNKDQPGWMQSLLDELYRVRADYITKEQQRLKSMGERPERQASCCSTEQKKKPDTKEYA